MVVPCADRWPAGHIFGAFVSPVRDGLIVAQRPGNRIILCDTSGDLDQEADCLGVLISHRVDGLVIAPVCDLSRGNLNRLARHGMPFVHIDRNIHGVECDAVQGDSSGGAFQIVDHLIRSVTAYSACHRVSHGVNGQRPMDARPSAAGPSSCQST